jgi:hypothetical protein
MKMVNGISISASFRVLKRTQNTGAASGHCSFCEKLIEAENAKTSE